MTSEWQIELGLWRIIHLGDLKTIDHSSVAVTMMHSACVSKRLARRRKRGLQSGSGKSSESSSGSIVGSYGSNPAVQCKGRLRRRPAQTSLLFEDDGDEVVSGRGGEDKAKFHSVSAVASAIDR